MQRSSRGIAMVALAVVVVAIIAVAAAAAYFALSSGSSPSSSSATLPTTSSTQSTTSSATTSAPLTTLSSATSSSTATTSSSIPTTTTTTSPTSSSTTTSSTTSSSSSTVSSFTCTNTSSTATSTSAPVDYTTQYIGLIKEFSSIQFKITGNYDGKNQNETFGYTTTTVQPGIYNVSATASSENGTLGSFVVDTNNNTVLSGVFGGFPLPQAYVKEEFDGVMGLFGLEEYYTGEIGVFTDPAYFTNQGTSTMTFGTVSFPVTTYGLNSANEVVDYCGVSATISSYSLSVGTPPGTSLLFITYLQFAGTTSGSSEDITFQLVSMTLQS